MYRRLISLAVLIIIAIIFGIRNRNTIRSTIPFIPKPETFIEPHPFRSDLNLTMSHIIHSPPILRITVTNLHPSTSLTLLSWETPFDPDAFESGVFQVTERGSTARILNAGSKLKHNLPATREAYIELEPRHAVTKDVTLEGPGIFLEKGKEYNVQAKGLWKIVWHANVADVGERELKLSAGTTGFMSWEYESDVVTVKVG